MERAVRRDACIIGGPTLAMHGPQAIVVIGGIGGAFGDTLRATTARAEHERRSIGTRIGERRRNDQKRSPTSMSSV